MVEASSFFKSLSIKQCDGLLYQPYIGKGMLPTLRVIPLFKGDTPLGDTPYEIEFLINFDICIMIFTDVCQLTNAYIIVVLLLQYAKSKKKIFFSL